MKTRTGNRPRIFLSASVPLPSRHPRYFKTANVLAIRDATRALTMVLLETRAQLVFGGHPAISPMIRLQIVAAKKSIRDQVVMYYSRFFEASFPSDHSAFENVALVDAVAGDRGASLRRMREEMLTGSFAASVYIGGMEGVEEEYEMFKRMHPGTPALPIASTGAAANKIYESDQRLKREHPELKEEISYLTLMRNLLSPLVNRN